MSKNSDSTAGKHPSAKGFNEAWDAFVLAIRRRQARGQAGEGLTLSQYYLLRPLEGGRSVPLCDLADAAGIAGPTATRVVDGLERGGDVRRKRPAKDRRTVLVSLTAQGRQRLASKRRQLEERRAHLYEQLEPDEREQSERLLRHLAELVGHL